MIQSLLWFETPVPIDIYIPEYLSLNDNAIHQTDFIIFILPEWKLLYIIHFIFFLFSFLPTNIRIPVLLLITFQSGICVLIIWL